MTEITKGEFLKTKLQNMARWATQEIGEENLRVDIITSINGRSELEVMLIAGALQANKDKAIHRDWVGLVQILADNKIPTGLQEVVVEVQKRPHMHDKFWRYVDLFIEVADS